MKFFPFTALLILAFATAANAHANPQAAPVDSSDSPLPRIRAIVLVPDESSAVLDVPEATTGVDGSRVPEFSAELAGETLSAYLGRPITPSAIYGLAAAVQATMQAGGQLFTVAYVPPQDVSTGAVRVVVTPAKLDGDLQIEGAKYFSEASYRAAVPLAAGGAIDAAVVQAGVDRLNRGGYRRVVVAAEPGATAGTTKLVLRTLETRPWSLSAGYNNTGTAVTDENRATAGVVWGNAFDRGDTLGYSFSADPALEHSISHSANYGTLFDSGHSLTAFGGYSTVESALPSPLTQEGRSWQVGVRFGVPLKPLAGGGTQTLAFTADFKASDNNLEFATIPITDNLTHIAQFGATYGMTFRALGGQNSVSLAGYVSPGGLSSRNHGRYFDGSRPGAKAQYAYAKLSLTHRRTLGSAGFWWSTAVEAQATSGALLGTEQLNGAGAYGVRGYGESAAFGDAGLLVNHELHLPACSPFKARDQADAFVFLDAAALHDRGLEGGSIELASAGIGLSYQVRRHFTLRAAYGWQLKALPNVAGEDSRGHVAATVTY